MYAVQAMLRSAWMRGGRIGSAALTRRKPGSGLAGVMTSVTDHAESHHVPVRSSGSHYVHRQLHFFSTLSDNLPSSSRVRAQFSSLALEIESDDDDDDEDHSGQDAARRHNERQQQQQQQQQRNSSTLPQDRHCETCTCEHHSSVPSPPLAPCGAVQTEYDPTPFPPPLPQPKYSVRRRLLSCSTSSPIALQSATGQQRLIQSLQQGTAASYIALTQHFLNQAEPAYCGVTTACMVLNAFELDLVWRWKGGWRYYADEDVVLQHCQGCMSKERLQRTGITADEFQRLVSCHGLDSTFKRPHDIANENNNANGGGQSTEAISDSDNSGDGYYSLEQFRSDVQSILTDTTTDSSSDESSNNSNKSMGIMVVSFCRATLNQTGDGHFSPIAAYHAASDSVLVLDVARYKYPPYWVSVEQMYRAMQPWDPATRKPRGWYLLYNKKSSNSNSNKNDGQGENRRPAHLVPVAGRDPHPCPMHTAQVQFCPNQEKDKSVFVKDVARETSRDRDKV